MAGRPMTRRKALGLIIKAGIAATLPSVNLLAEVFRRHGQSLRYFQKMSFVMGQLLSMEVLAPGPEEAARAFRTCSRLFFEYDRRLSMYREDSEAMRLSQNAGKHLVRVSPLTLRAVNSALHYSKQTGGVFDITIEPLLRRLGFRSPGDVRIAPLSATERDAIRRQINYRWIEVKGRQLRLAHPAMALDFGGIACGLALDAAIAALKKMDIAAAFLNISGDIACYGASEINPVGWKVFLKNPHTGAPETERPLLLQDEALSTSGNYENFRFLKSGQKIGHIYNPATLKPAPLNGSLTVVAPTAVEADVWSTAGWAGSPTPGTFRKIKLG